MSAATDSPRGGRVLSKGRMEGFSDGVFGSAITLLVVDIVLRPRARPCSRRFTPGPPTWPTSQAS
jgi:hypothetical protein